MVVPPQERPVVTLNPVVLLSQPTIAVVAGVETVGGVIVKVGITGAITRGTFIKNDPPPPPHPLVDFEVEIESVSTPSPFLYFTEYVYEVPQDNPVSVHELVCIQPEFVPFVELEK